MENLKFLNNLSIYFEKLPGVGKKTASRYSYAVVEKMTIEEVESFAKTLVDIKKNVKHCEICGMLALSNKCEICENSFRDKQTVMVVKDTKDVLAIERTNQYNGLYHVLGGLISPIDGIGPDELNIDSLEKRLNTEEIEEVIISTSFTPQGETTAIYLEKILANDNVVITRIGYGLPAGGDIEYVDELTLRRAIDARIKK